MSKDPQHWKEAAIAQYLAEFDELHEKYQTALNRVEFIDGRILQSSDKFVEAARKLTDAMEEIVNKNSHIAAEVVALELSKVREHIEAEMKKPPVQIDYAKLGSVVANQVRDNQRTDRILLGAMITLSIINLLVSLVALMK